MDEFYHSDDLGRPCSAAAFARIMHDYHWKVRGMIFVPKYKGGFRQIVIGKLAFVRFCKDLDNANCSMPVDLGRASLEAAWCELMVRYWRKWNGEGMKLPGYRTEEEQEEMRKAELRAAFQQRFSKEAEEYWLREKVGCPKLDITEVLDDLHDDEVDADTEHIERDVHDENEGEDGEEGDEDDDDEDEGNADGSGDDIGVGDGDGQ